MGFKQRFSEFFQFENENNSEESYRETEDKSQPSNDRKPYIRKVNNNTGEKLRPRSNSSNQLSVISNESKSVKQVKPKISIMEPRIYSEAKEIADLLLANQSVIVNFKRMDHEYAKQTIDFLSGVTYALEGDIQKIGEDIFICTPANVDIDGNELSSVREPDFF